MVFNIKLRINNILAENVNKTTVIPVHFNFRCGKQIKLFSTCDQCLINSGHLNASLMNNNIEIDAHPKKNTTPVKSH